MLIIKIWCLPANQLESCLRALHQQIVDGVVQIPELNYKDENDIFVLFPTDQMSYGLGCQILVEISTIGEWLPTDTFYRERLAGNVCTAIKNKYKKAKVYVKVNPSGGSPERSWFSNP